MVNVTRWTEHSATYIYTQCTTQLRHGFPCSRGVVPKATYDSFRILYMLALSSYEYTFATQTTYRLPVQPAPKYRYYTCEALWCRKSTFPLTSSARITSRCLRSCTTLLRSLHPRHAAWMRTTAASRAARVGPAR